MIAVKRICAAAASLIIVLACSISQDTPTEPALTANPPASPLPFASPTPLPTATPIPTPAAEVRNDNGEQALFFGDWEAASGEFQNALSISPDDSERGTALLGLARSQMNARDYPNALNTLRELTAGTTDPVTLGRAYVALGMIFDTLQRYSEAAEAYSSFLEVRPGIIDGYVLEWLGDSYANAKDFDNARSAYEAALSIPRIDETASLEIKLAGVHSAGGDPQSALAIYQAAQTRTENEFIQAQLRRLLGETYLALGNPDAAYQEYLFAVENYPLSYDTYLALVELVEAGQPVDEFDRGLVDYFAGQYGVAIAAFDRYLVATPEEHRGAAHYYKGLALRALGDLQAAMTEFDEIILGHPGENRWTDAWDEKAFTQWAYLDQYSAAVGTLLDFVATAPESPEASQFLYDAGRISERNGDLESAAAIWERVAVEYPLSENAYRAMFLAGITRYRQGAYTQASELFLRSLGLARGTGEEAAVQLWIGKTELALGDEVGARAAWERAAILDPTGYYSERASDLLLDQTPFTTTGSNPRPMDVARERTEAEIWMRIVFGIPDEVDLSGLGKLAADPRLIRGTELWHLGLLEEARGEFEALRSSILTDAESNYRLANYLVELGLYRTAVFAARQVLNLAGMDDAGTTSAPLYFNHIRFGKYYSELVDPMTETYAFDPLFLYSVMRQESLFEGFIRSSAGARGLMQIIPSTGQAIHNLIGWPPDYSADDLYRPKVSITFGADHLADLREIFAGDLYAALAGYNAGQGNAAIWKSIAPDDQDLYLEVVRFEETRRYIRAIYEIYNLYRRFYTEPRGF